jgi:hypothetical protein
MLIDPIGLGEFNRQILSEPTRRVGNGQAGRNAHQLQISLSIVATSGSNNHFLANAADTRTRRGAECRCGVSPKLHQDLVGDELGRTDRTLSGTLRRQKGQSSHR